METVNAFQPLPKVVAPQVSVPTQTSGLPMHALAQPVADTFVPSTKQGIIEPPGYEKPTVVYKPELTDKQKSDEMREALEKPMYSEKLDSTGIDKVSVPTVEDVKPEDNLQTSNTDNNKITLTVDKDGLVAQFANFLDSLKNQIKEDATSAAKEMFQNMKSELTKQKDELAGIIRQELSPLKPAPVSDTAPVDKLSVEDVLSNFKQIEAGASTKSETSQNQVK